MQNENVNVDLLISAHSGAHRLTSTTENDKVQDLHYVLCFVKVKQQTHSASFCPYLELFRIEIAVTFKGEKHHNKTNSVEK